MRKIHVILMLAGIITILIGAKWGINYFNMDTSVQGFGYGKRIHNLSLADHRRNNLMGAAVTCISGLIVFGLGYLRFNTNRADASSRISNTDKKCPYCAELIKRDAVICRYCNRDIPADTSQINSYSSTSHNNIYIDKLNANMLIVISLVILLISFLLPWLKYELEYVKMVDKVKSEYVCFSLGIYIYPIYCILTVKLIPKLYFISTALLFVAYTSYELFKIPSFVRGTGVYFAGIASIIYLVNALKFIKYNKKAEAV